MHRSFLICRSLICLIQPRKIWQRFREIPDWIDASSRQRGVSPTDIINELEEMRGKAGQKKGLNALSKAIKELRIQHELESKSQVQTESESVSPAFHP
jgi:hypothetical protein